MSIDYQTIQNLGLAAKPAAAPQTGNSTVMGQDMFMKLLVTQLQNQNPLKPQDGAEFIAQLAQFTQVSDLESLKTSFSDFAAGMNQQQALQSAGLVGKDVLAPAKQAVLSADGQVHGEITVPAGASNVALRIYDAGGAEVHSFNLGVPGEGQTEFDWNGLLADGVSHAQAGVYTVKVEATIDGKNTALDTQIRAPVQGVVLGGSNGVEVDLGVLGRKSLKDIRAIM